MKPWMNEPEIEDRSFRITDLVHSEDPILVDRTFRNCTIYGPAVLVGIEDIEMVGNSLDGPLDAIFWEIPPERTAILGAVGLIRCRFYDCAFRGIGIGGPREIRIMMEGATADQENEEN